MLGLLGLVVLGLQDGRLVAEFELEFVPFLLDQGDLHLHVVHLALQLAVGYFQVVTLLEPLGATVLGVPAVLEGSPFLFEAYDLIPGTAVESLVEFPNGQGHEHFVVKDAVVAAVAAGVAASTAGSMAWGCKGSGGAD